MATVEKTTRSDAERNRLRIIGVAEAVFADRGAAATLNDVARAAGVGVGTVYRKFADKDEVFDALFETKIDRLVGIAEEAAAIADAGEAFRSFIWGVFEARARDRAFAVVVAGAGRGLHFTEQLGARLAPVAWPIISRAVAAGEARPGFTGQDVCILAMMVGEIADTCREVNRDVWRRYASIIIDGLRPTAERMPMHPRPLSFEQTVEVLGTPH